MTSNRRFPALQRRELRRLRQLSELIADYSLLLLGDDSISLTSSSGRLPAR